MKLPKQPKKLTLPKIFKKRSKMFAAVSFIIIFALVGAYILMVSLAAGNATFTLSPASSTPSLGSTLTITIQENSSSELINAVEADLTYDQTKLQFVSIDTSVGPFNITAQKTGGSGTVKISVAASPSISGTQTVATVTFNTIGVGTTAVSFAGTSVIVRASDATNILGTSTGGSYTIQDKQAPTVPTGLTMSSHTTSTINMAWTASSDNIGVTGYKVYRGGTQIGTSVTNSYADSGLSPGISYSYTVAAYDAGNNTSAQSTAGAFSTLSQSGDINGDGHVNITDLSILATNYGKSSMTKAQGDLNNDGSINVFDLSILAASWGI
jgi:hypothetical protein